MLKLTSGLRKPHNRCSISPVVCANLINDAQTYKRSAQTSKMMQKLTRGLRKPLKPCAKFTRGLRKPLKRCSNSQAVCANLINDVQTHKKFAQSS